jgi:hypothetical protein
MLDGKAPPAEVRPSHRPQHRARPQAGRGGHARPVRCPWPAPGGGGARFSASRPFSRPGIGNQPLKGRSHETSRPAAAPRPVGLRQHGRPGRQERVRLPGARWRGLHLRFRGVCQYPGRDAARPCRKRSPPMRIPGQEHPTRNPRGQAQALRGDRPPASTAPAAGTPLLSPPRVLRLWLAPWVDEDGDLHDQAYLYVMWHRGEWQLGHTETGIRRQFAPIVPGKRPPMNAPAGARPSDSAPSTKPPARTPAKRCWNRHDASRQAEDDDR